MSLQERLRYLLSQDSGRTTLPNTLILNLADALDALTTELAAAKAERDAMKVDADRRRVLLARCQGWINKDHPFWEVGKKGALEHLFDDVKGELGAAIGSDK